MIKTAVFVEGQTELIVVREFLLKHFQYSNIDLICRRLIAYGDDTKAAYDFPNPEAENHFQILQVGNDVAVLSSMLKRESNLLKIGYGKVIGLRDMYSAKYRELSLEINPTINAKFIEGAKQSINSKPHLFFHFAIMETEAWFLTLPKLFEKISSQLTIQNINNSLNLNIESNDPETTYFHPASTMNKIFALANLSYDKKLGTIESLVSRIDTADIQYLYADKKCKSFSDFWNDLLNIKS